MPWPSTAILVLILLTGFVIGIPDRCFQFRSPPSRVVFHDSDSGFELRLRRPQDKVMVDDWYEPGSYYTVELVNKLPMLTFNDYLFWLTSPDKKDFPASETAPNSSQSVCMRSMSKCLGKWIHQNGWLGSRRTFTPMSYNVGSTQTRIGCKGLIAERDHRRAPRPVSKVILKWKAPELHPEGNSGCVLLHAAVRTPYAAWREVGGLMKKMCPSKMRPMESVLSEVSEYNTPRPPVLGGVPPQVNAATTPGAQSPREMRPRDTMLPKDCCACGTATYNFTFQGLWNYATHPRDWPLNKTNLLHWTNLIGATHSPSYNIYSIGRPASAGVQSICAYGDTTVMRQALTLAASKSEGASGVPTGSQSASTEVSPLRSLLSTAGMWSEEKLNEPRSTLISVNRTHPVVSMLTMLGPSPDWCTGISGQSVCKADCTWVDKLELALYPWDAGIRNGDTYMPKKADRNEIPDPIRYIDESWMPNSPFFEHKPVARVTMERILPKHNWECTNKVADGVQLFEMGGNIRKVGEKPQMSGNSSNSADQMSNSAALVSPVTSKGTRKRGKGGSVGFGGPGASGTIGTNNPFSDPSLAQMATFLCITDDWSDWSTCSVTCGVGKRTRHRNMVENKKPELCQHVPLIMSEPCEGRQRTCDFSAPCSLLPWSNWSPCNATCNSLDASGFRWRRRSLARFNESGCDHVFPTPEERARRIINQVEACKMPVETCDPATICGEGPKEGYPCGNPISSFYYSAIEHKCLPFAYLGCKGGRNRFKNVIECEQFCIPVVEALPAWRRERMGLLQYKTSELSSMEDIEIDTKKDPACQEEVNVGIECSTPVEWKDYWHYCPRTRSCRDFLYLGCEGTANRFENHTDCMAACMPTELRKSQQLSKLRTAARKRTSTEDNEPREELIEGLGSLDEFVQPKQDCRVTKWGAWGPCSVRCASMTGRQIRLRAVLRPSRYGGKTCGPLFERRQCFGVDEKC